MKINFEEILKLPLFAILGALNFVDVINFRLEKVQKVQKMHKYQNSASKCVKMADFESLDSSTLISRKI